MKNKLAGNVGLKVMSVLLGFGAWLAVTNISNPEVTRTKTVPLTVLNAQILTDAGKTYEIENGDSVTVSYTVRTGSASRISADDFRATVDLANLYSLTGSVPVTVEVLDHKDLISGTPTARPGIIRVTMEDIQNKSFDLTTRTVGNPADGYAVGSLSLNPDHIMVSGPVSLVGRISSVGVEVDVTDASEDFSGTTGVVFYDANGNKFEISDDRITCRPEQVDFSVDMLRGKTLPLSFETSGEAASGYRFTGAECSVKSVAVVGEKSTLDSLNELVIPASALNVSNATENRDVVLDLNQYLPSGVSVNGTSTVTVTLKVEALNTKAFQLSLNSGITETGQQDQYVYRLDPELISVELSGLPEDLDKITAAQLLAQIDFTGMQPGVHEGKLSLTAPTGTTIATVTPFTVIVRDESGGPGETVPETPAAETSAEESGASAASAGHNSETGEQSGGNGAAAESAGSSGPSGGTEESSGAAEESSGRSGAAGSSRQRESASSETSATARTAERVPSESTSH